MRDVWRDDGLQLSAEVLVGMRVLPARDASVPWKDEADIEVSARKLRQLAGIDAIECVNVGKLLDWLTETDLPGIGKLEISILTTSIKQYEAFVTYKPLRLHIQKTPLLHGRLGYFYYKYVLAHEIGHMILHDEYAKPFSVSPINQKLVAGSFQKSAEWQANRFADHLLIPDHILIEMHSLQELKKACGIADDLAERRWPGRAALLRAGRKYAGDPCPECQNFTMVGMSLSLKCDTCGAITGYF